MKGLTNITVLYAILAVTSLCGVTCTSLIDKSSTVDQRYNRPLGINDGIQALTKISSNRNVDGDNENGTDEDDGNDSGDSDDEGDNNGDEDDGGKDNDDTASPTATTTEAPTSKVTEATPIPTITPETPAPTAAKPAEPSSSPVAPPAPAPDSSETNKYRFILSCIILTVWCIVLIIFCWTLRVEIPEFCIKVCA